MAKSKKKKKQAPAAKQLEQSGFGNHVVLGLLGSVVAAGSRNDRLSKGTRKTLKSLRESIGDAEKKAKKDASRRKARKARRRVLKDLKASAGDRSKAVAKGATVKSAKAGGKAAKASAKKAPAIATARLGTKAVKAERRRKKRRSAN